LIEPGCRGSRQHVGHRAPRGIALLNKTLLRSVETRSSSSTALRSATAPQTCAANCVPHIRLSRYARRTQPFRCLLAGICFEHDSEHRQFSQLDPCGIALYMGGVGVLALTSERGENPPDIVPSPECALSSTVFSRNHSALAIRPQGGLLRMRTPHGLRAAPLEDGKKSGL
jgi:hypothetical protein